MKTVFLSIAVMAMLILGSCAKEDVDEGPQSFSNESEAKLADGDDGIKVWDGVWICTDDEDGCIWPETVVPCWDMVGICMIEVVGAAAAANYGLSARDIPALVYNDVQSTVVKNTTVVRRSITGNKIHYTVRKTR